MHAVLIEVHVFLVCLCVLITSFVLYMYVYSVCSLAQWYRIALNVRGAELLRFLRIIAETQNLCTTKSWYTVWSQIRTSYFCKYSKVANCEN